MQNAELLREENKVSSVLQNLLSNHVSMYQFLTIPSCHNTTQDSPPCWLTVQRRRQRQRRTRRNAQCPCSPHCPPAAAACQQSASADINGIAQAMGRASLRDGRQFTAFNFNYRFPVIWTIAGPLADGHMVFYGDYLAPTLHLMRYNCTVSEDGLTATLSMELPSVYTDVRGRAKAGEHGARGADEVLFIAGACNTTDSIAAIYDNLDGITPPGQQDPLPFPCCQRTDITHVYHEGDILLNQDIANQPSFQRMGVGRQLYAFVRVAFVSVESVHVGGSYFAMNHQVFQSPQGWMYNNTTGGGGDGGSGGGSGGGRGFHGSGLGSGSGGGIPAAAMVEVCEHHCQHSRSAGKQRNCVEFEVNEVEEGEEESKDNSTKIYGNVVSSSSTTTSL